MKLAIVFLFVCGIASTLACPTPGDVPSIFTPRTIDYFDNKICVEENITLKESVSTTITKTFEKQIKRAKCEYLSRFDSYPEIITQSLASYSPELLRYDFLVIGSNLSVLQAAVLLAQEGYTVLIVNEGGLNPIEALSPYNKYDIWQDDDYVSSVPITINGAPVTKNLYRSKLFGQTSAILPFTWQYGQKSAYSKLTQVSEKFSYESFEEQYNSILSYDDSCGSIRNSYQTSTTTNSYINLSTSTTTCSAMEYMFNGFNEAGFSQAQNIQADTIGRPAGVYKDLILGTPSSPQLLHDMILKSLVNTGKIKLALNTIAKQLVVKENQIVGADLILPNNLGEVRVIPKYEVLLGSDVLSILELLAYSGIGSNQLLTARGISTLIDLTGLGQDIHATPEYHGTFIECNQGSLLSQSDNYDSLALQYLFGVNRITEVDAVEYHTMYLNVDNTEEVDVAITFRVFNRWSTNHFENIARSVYQYDEEAIEIIKITLQTKDILIPSITLLNPRSVGNVEISSSGQLTISNLLYSHDQDINTIARAILKLKELEVTPSFRNINAIYKQMPVQGLHNFFTNDFCLQQIPYYSTPGVSLYGGFTTRNVVTSDFLLHGMENIRIISNSVFPTYLGNSLAPSIALGHIASRSITDRLNRGTNVVTRSNDILKNESLLVKESSSENSLSRNLDSNLNGITHTGLGSSNYLEQESYEREQQSKVFQSESLNLNDVSNVGVGLRSLDDTHLNSLSSFTEQKYESEEYESSSSSNSASSIGYGSDDCGISGFESVDAFSEQKYEREESESSSLKSASSIGYGSDDCGIGGFESVDAFSKQKYEREEFESSSSLKSASSIGYDSDDCGISDFESVDAFSEQKYELEESESSSWNSASHFGNDRSVGFF